MLPFSKIPSTVILFALVLCSVELHPSAQLLHTNVPVRTRSTSYKSTGSWAGTSTTQEEKKTARQHTYILTESCAVSVHHVSVYATVLPLVALVPHRPRSRRRLTPHHHHRRSRQCPRRRGAASAPAGPAAVRRRGLLRRGPVELHDQLLAALRRRPLERHHAVRQGHDVLPRGAHARLPHPARRERQWQRGYADDERGGQPRGDNAALGFETRDTGLAVGVVFLLASQDGLNGEKEPWTGGNTVPNYFLCLLMSKMSYERNQLYASIHTKTHAVQFASCSPLLLLSRVAVSVHASYPAPGRQNTRDGVAPLSE